MPTIAALHERGDAVVKQVLAENHPRWESLGEADRRRLELVATTIVKRLLREPTLRLKARGDDRRTYAYVQALRELFGLDTGPLGHAEAEVTSLDEHRAERDKRSG